MHCGFIAHYNRQGFYNEYFVDPEYTIKFLEQFDADSGYCSVELGSDEWFSDEDYVDLNKAMVEEFGKHKDRIYKEIRDKILYKKEELQYELAKRELEDVPTNKSSSLQTINTQ